MFLLNYQFFFKRISSRNSLSLSVLHVISLVFVKYIFAVYLCKYCIQAYSYIVDLFYPSAHTSSSKKWMKVVWNLKYIYYKFQLPHRRQGPLSRPVWVSTYSIKGSLKLIEKLEKIGAMVMVTLFLAVTALFCQQFTCYCGLIGVHKTLMVFPYSPALHFELYFSYTNYRLFLMIFFD